MDEITVVGGGLAGLIAASEVAEAGRPVRLLEAHQQLGGRARSIGGDYAANHGPHALYTYTELWRWLRARDLHGPAPRPQVRNALLRVRFRWQGELRRTPPRAALLRALRHARRQAPVEEDLRSWATEVMGEDAAQMLCGAAGPLVFDPDPGRLSAAFVADKARATYSPVTPARYVVGGWTALVDRLAAHARSVGVRIELGHRLPALDDVAAAGPVIVALDPGGARKLLADDSLTPAATRVALLDLGLRHRRGDPYVVFDLDGAVFVDRFTAVIPSLAPSGHDLVQASVGLHQDEGLESGVARIEAVLDLAFAGWRERVAWRRRGLVSEATGAVDLPGTTWRDRTPLAYADGVWLAGDWVAAPGHLAEVSCTSAVRSAREAVAALERSHRRLAS